MYFHGFFEQTTDHVGTAALGCPVERSSTAFCLVEKSRSFAPQDSRGGCPYVACGSAYIVSARNRPDLIAYWEEIPAKHECSCIADVDGGQLCHPAEACPAEAVSAGADAGAPVPLQPGLRRLRQDPISGACPQAPAVAPRSASGRSMSAAHRWFPSRAASP